MYTAKDGCPQQMWMVRAEADLACDATQIPDAVGRAGPAGSVAGSLSRWFAH